VNSTNHKRIEKIQANQKMNKPTKRFIYLYAICCFLVTSTISQAQDTVVLKFNHYYNQVIANHPIVKQGRLLTEQAKMELRSARGNFDPSVQIDFRNKSTNNNNTFTYFMPEVKIPTRLGVDLKGGYERSSGTGVNPEIGKFDPVSGTYVDYGLLYGGVSIPIGQGLLFDPRRAALQQAKLMQTLAEAEQVKLINKLLLETAKVYWEWQQMYDVLRLMEENMRVALDRLTFINKRIALGEEKPIDSVEASIEYKRREVLYIEAQIDYTNTSILLSNHLWDEKGQPLQLRDNVIPESYGENIGNVSTDSLQNMVRNARDKHPEIVAMSTKIKSLDVERRLYAELIKPQLTIDYHPFQTFTQGNQDNVPNIFQNNYKLGASFYMPLLLRKERGKLQATNYKIKQSKFEFEQMQRSIINNILISYNDVQNLNQVLSIQENLVRNAIILRDAEEIRFENGESSLFLVNVRERSLIESQTKLVELRAKFAKSLITLQWSSGARMFD
jgi:outer membrane protein TolC